MKRYSDEELEEFRELINKKIAKATAEYDELRAGFVNDTDNGISDTAPTYSDPDDGYEAKQREALERMCDRQLQFIKKLQAALVRIDNKTYGICRVTGELIPKERLRAVPHATLSIEAKSK